MTLKNRIKYFIKDLDFLRAYNSPFKPLKLQFYCGKVALGTPYFFPRKWVKATPALAIKAAVRNSREARQWNKNNPNYPRKEKSFRELYDESLTRLHAVPKKIGFDFVPLGWKTKWRSDDYRFEWSPMISFVFFKWQIAVTFVAPEMHHYWECWLYYTRETDKSLPTSQRIAQARKEFPCVWTNTTNGKEKKVCYWDVILKNKWL